MFESGASELVACSSKFIWYHTIATTAIGTLSSSGSGGAADQRIEVRNASGVESVMKVHMYDNFNPKTFLASVSRLSQAGHRVVFYDPVIGSYTEIKNTGVVTWPR